MPPTLQEGDYNQEWVRVLQEMLTERGIPTTPDADIVELYRFEGESDPGDESVVIALRCHVCGAEGSLVAAYGMAADGAEADVLAALVDRRSGRPEPP